MKRFVLIITSIVLALTFVGCSKDAGSNNVIRIGVSPVPHKELVELVVEDLKEEGIELEIIEFGRLCKTKPCSSRKGIRC